MTPEPQPPAAKPDPGLKSLSEIVTLTGVSAGKISYAVKEGFIASTVRGRYQLGPTLVGLVKFFAARAAQLPVYDNASQCSAATGIPIPVIKQARKTKSLGHGGNVSLATLLQVIFEQGADQDWPKLKAKFAALREQTRHERETGALIPQVDVAGSLRASGTSIKSILRQRLENEYPAFVSGLQPPEARVFGKRLADEIIKEFAALSALWPGDLQQVGEAAAAEGAKAVVNGKAGKPRGKYGKRPPMRRTGPRPQRSGAGSPSSPV